MDWLTRVVMSSIGKKYLMALTGLGFIGFLCGHLAGNLTMYKSREAFISYAEHLHALGPLITAAEIGLLSFAVVHVLTGLTLFYQNFRSRPERYCVNKSAGGRTIGSRTMPYTGFLVLIFVVIHLLNFHFVDKTNTTIFHIVAATFENTASVLFYVFSMAVVAIHVSHGLWSSFQTLGANHPKYMPGVMILSVVFAVVVGVGFGFLPIYVTMMG